MKFSLKAFILAVIFCAVVISAKNVYSCDFSAQADKGIQRAINYGTIERLYSGSSMFRQGINIHEMEQKSKSRFLIWYGGLDPVSEAAILEYMISVGLEIKNFYVDMYAYSASAPSWPSDVRMFFESPLLLKIKIWRSTMKNERAKLIPVAWEMFIHSGNDIFIAWPLFRHVVNTTYYRGGYPDLARNYNPGITLEAMQKLPVIGDESSRMNPVQKAAIINIIKLCEKNNINLSFIETPKYTSINHSIAYRNIMTEYVYLLKEYGVNCIISGETLKSIGAEHTANIKSYEFDHGKTENFTDNIHLSTAGSGEFTHILMELE